MVTTPSEASFLVATHGPLNISRRQFGLEIVAMETEVLRDTHTSVTIEIIDEFTLKRAKSIHWMVSWFGRQERQFRTICFYFEWSLLCVLVQFKNVFNSAAKITLHLCH